MPEPKDNSTTVDFNKLTDENSTPVEEVNLDDFFQNLDKSVNGAIYDEPQEDFELIDSVLIPAGSYWDNRLELQLSTFKGRKLSASGEINVGEFYTGDRQTYELYTYFNFNKHLNIGIDWQRNNIQLPEKSFSTNKLTISKYL